MKRRNATTVRALALATFAALGARTGLAQNPAWTANLIVQPSPSPFVSDWNRNPNIAILTVLYTGRAGQSYRVEAYARNARGELGRVISPPFSFAFGPSTQLVTASDIFNWNTESSNRTYVNLVERTGRIPEGAIQLCARVLDLSGTQLTQTCTVVTVALPDAPQLVYPPSRGAVTEVQPVFQWTPVVVPPEVGVTYRVRIAEVRPQQTPKTALAANIPLFDQQVGNVPMLTYPLNALPLESGKTYAWQVQALDQNGLPIARNEGASQMWTFTLGGPGRPPPTLAGTFPDTLTLVPGMARLSGLATASVTETPFAYVVDGQATLNVLAPFRARMRVGVQGLQVDKMTRALRGGSLGGSLAVGSLPPGYGNPYLRFTRIAFDPQTGFTLSASLALPGITAPLSGTVQLTAAGPSGRLEAAAPSGDSLATLGGDPAGFRITAADVSLPDGALTLSGGIELFGEDIGCGVVSGALDAQGKLSASVACRPSRPVALVPDVSRMQLALTSVGGAFGADLAAGTVTYQLTAAAQLALDAGGAACGGSLSIAVANGTVTPGSFASSCDPAQASADLGWLAARLSNLRLQRLGYQAGQGFDFALQVDLAPWIPVASGLQLPAATAVTVDRNGLTVPATEVSVTRGPVSVAGFGVQVTHVGLPGFTLSWKDWQAHAASGFAFSVDGKVSYAGLPQDSPACLANAPFPVTGARLADGQLTATLADQTFNPACAVPLPAGAALEIQGVGGQLGVAFAPQLAVTTLPSVRAALLLPSYFACASGTDRTLSLPSSVQISPQGVVSGHLTGLAPACPIDLAAVQIGVTDAALDFAASPAGAQTADLTGVATAKFTAGSNTVTGSGSVAIDLIQGRLASGTLSFQGPFELDLPRNPAFLAFTVGAATLDTAGLHVDGRGQLLLPSQVTVNATFDRVTVNPLTAAVTAGRILFDAPFALELGVGSGGSLAWRAVATGAQLDVTSGVRLDLPTQLAVDSAGIAVSGSATGRLVYGGRDLDSLAVTFSSDFRLSIGPPGVSGGSASFGWHGADVGSVDAQGFHPNLAALATNLLPDRLGLPTASVAYLQIRDANGNLLVSSEPAPGGGVRVYTPANVTVPLVVPALQLGRASPPQVDVAFDVTLDPTGGGITAGSVSAQIGGTAAPAFDLSPAGLPYAVQGISYAASDGGPYQLTVTGTLTLFGAQEGSQVALQIDATGRLSGTVGVTLPNAVSLQLAPGFPGLTLAVSGVSGTFDVPLLGASGGSARYDLQATSRLVVGAPGGQQYAAGATIEASDAGMQVRNLTVPTGADSIAYLDLGVVQLGVSRLVVPTLSYDRASGAWSFDLQFDAALRFPQLGGLTVGPVSGVEVTPSGITIPQINLPQLAVAPAQVAGFELTPVAFRTAGPITYDWVNARGPADWGFAFDLEIGFGAGAPQALSGVQVSVLGAGLANGVFTGQIEPFTPSVPIALPWGTIEQLGGALETAPRTVSGVVQQTQGVRVSATGHYRYPSLLRCQAAPGDTSAAIAVTVSAAGLLAGTVQNVVPSCPAQLGPLAVQVTASSLAFSVSAAGQQQAELDGTGTVALPAPSGSGSVSAAGTLAVDLIHGGVLRGSLALTKPFRWSLPADAPLLTFDVSSGKIDSTGLTLSGSGALMLGAGDSVVATLHDLLLGIPDFAVKSGSVSLAGGFALAAGIDQDARLQWQAVRRDATPPGSVGLVVQTPDTVALGPAGLRLGGTASAVLAYEGKTWDASQLAVRFDSGFTMGFAPVAVDSGRAALVVGQDTVAYVTPSGFEPGDVFGLLPLPDSVPLPDFGIAYVRLKAGGKLLIPSPTVSGTQISIQTGPASGSQPAGIPLVIPALANGGAAPTVYVSGSFTINANTRQFVSGSISVTASGNQSLFSLQQLGLPLTVERVAYEVPSTPGSGGAYQLDLDARLQLPASLGGAAIKFTDIAVGSSGLSGTVSAGAYSATPPATPAAAIATVAVGSDVQVAFTGATLTFGTGANGEAPAAKVSGRITTTLFKGSNGQTPIYFAGQVASGGQFTLTAAGTLPALPLGVATFTPQSVPAQGGGTLPAVQFTATDQNFSVALSGVLALARNDAQLAVTIGGLTIDKSGVNVASVAVAGNGPQDFTLFGVGFALHDVSAPKACPAVAAAYGGGVFTLTLSGDVTAFGNTSTFCGLSVGSDGSVAIAGATLVGSPVTLVQGVLTLDSLKILGATPQNPSLAAFFGVTLPKPLGGDQPAKGMVSVAEDGTVAGGGTIPIITPGGALAAPTLSVGRVSVAVREVDLIVGVSGAGALGSDFLKNSAVSAVAAVCYSASGGATCPSDDGEIDIGSVTSSSNTGQGSVQPGLTVHFNGGVDLTNVTLAHPFTVDSGFLLLRVTKALTPATPPTNAAFALQIGGTVGFNLQAVDANITFDDFLITSTGDVQFSLADITGASVSIGDVVTISAHDLGYSTTGARIWVPTSGGSSAGDDSVQVNVTSYLSFGATVTVGVGSDASFSGGVRRVLVYQQDDNTRHILVDSLALSILGGKTFAGFAEMRYDQLDNGGWNVLVAASASVMGTPGAVVVGALGEVPDASGNRALHVGLFVAATGFAIPVPGVPVITITGLGGGFFLRPEAADLQAVSNAVQLPSFGPVPQTKVKGPTGHDLGLFAVMLYGQVSIGTNQIAQGDVLLTVTGNYLEIDGQVTLLPSVQLPGMTAKGDAMVRVGLLDLHPYAMGLINFNIEYGVDGYDALHITTVTDPGASDPFANGIGFYVIDANTWGVQGTLDATMVSYLDLQAKLFLGPPGFYASGNFKGTYDFTIFSLSGLFGGQIWFWKATGDWGAYVSLGVELSVLDGAATATGTLYGALIHEAGDPFEIYMGGTLTASCPAGSWTGNVWAKVDGSGVSADFGDDPSMDQAIADAQAQAQSILGQSQAAESAIQSALASARNAQIGIPVTALAKAYLSILSANTVANDFLQANQPGSAAIGGFLEVLFASFVGAEYQAQEQAVLPQPSDAAYFGRYLGYLMGDGMPADTGALNLLALQLNGELGDITARAPQVVAALGSLQSGVQQLAQTPLPQIPSQSPVTDHTGVQVVVDGATGRPTAQPTFSVDAGAAADARQKAQQYQAAAQAYEQQVRQQLQVLEAGLAQARAATSADTGASFLGLVGDYREAARMVEEQFARHADLMLRVRDWAAGGSGWISSETSFLHSTLGKEAQTLRLTVTNLHPVITTQFIGTGAAREVKRDTSWVGDTGVALATVTNARMQQLLAWTNNSADVKAQQAQLQSETGGLSYTAPVWVKWADTLGAELYYYTGLVGLQAESSAALATFQQLVQQEPTALQAIGAPYLTLSNDYAALAHSQAALESRLYDMYARYLAWKGKSGSAGTLTAVGTGSGSAGTPTLSGATLTLVQGSGGAGGAQAVGSLSLQGSSAVPNLDDRAAIQTRMQALAQDLTVPTVTGVSVRATSASPYMTQLTFTWSGQHPSGLYEYLWNDFGGSSQGITPGSFYSNGGLGTRSSFQLTPNPNAAATATHTFQVGVRGGAGYVGVGRTNYTVSFGGPPASPGGTAPGSAVSGGGLLRDSTPPGAPTLSYPSNGPVTGPDGTQRIWTGDRGSIELGWTAYDAESGIGEYDYAVQTANPLPSVSSWTSVGGRTDLVIGSLQLSPSWPTRIEVRAKNGQGLTGPAAASLPVYYDSTPPVWPAGAAITGPAVSSAPLLPGGGATSAPVAACTVKEPPFPSLPTLGGLSQGPAVAISWTGSLSTPLPGLVTLASSGATPSIVLARPDASDPESGVWQYFYHFGPTPDSVWSQDGWSEILKGSQFSASGSPLDFSSQFYASVIARNSAGEYSRPLVYGPFQVPDPTPPTQPDVCVSQDQANSRLTATLGTTVASDPETGVTGYQYRVRRLAGSPVRDWPAGGAVDWQGGGSAGATFATAALSLATGTRYYVDVRAVNGQGMTGGVVTSGPLLYDATPPPTPSATLALTAKGLQVTINDPGDPETGVLAEQIAVGTTATSADVVPWSDVAGAAAGVRTVGLGVTPNSGSYVLRLRSVNGAGVASAIFSLQFAVSSAGRLEILR